MLSKNTVHSPSSDSQRSTTSPIGVSIPNLSRQHPAKGGKSSLTVSSVPIACSHSVAQAGFQALLLTGRGVNKP